MCWYSISGSIGCEGWQAKAPVPRWLVDGGCGNLNASHTSKGVPFACQ
jgi:hypothetical protein